MMSRPTRSSAPIGVFYLARGADHDCLEKFRAFRDSYSRWPAGAEHVLYVIYKGFANAASLEEAHEVLGDLVHRDLYLEDEWLDLGAYYQAASRVGHEKVCFLNTASKICGANWLLKLAVNLSEEVGMVSCSANYEAPEHPGLENVPFPNPHLRTNGFLIRRNHFLEFLAETDVRDKTSAYMLEHGPSSFTRRFAERGLKSLLVGRNGRGYEPPWYANSNTFRQGAQSNLLIADNQTTAFDKATPDEKRALYYLSWGDAGTRHLNGQDLPEQLARNLER